MRQILIAALAAGFVTPVAAQRKETCPLEPPKTRVAAPAVVVLTLAGVSEALEKLHGSAELTADGAGRLAIAEPAGHHAPVLAEAVLAELRPRLVAAAPDAQAWDTEVAVRLGGETRLVRVVVGRDGAFGGDGASPGIVHEDRSGTTLIVAGGNGGYAFAGCAVLNFPVPFGCQAIAFGGQGGHGASGHNNLGAGGTGGAGGYAAPAQAWSCCGCKFGQTTVVGHSVAVSGTGGHGGNGGNSGIALGGAGGNGGANNIALAMVFPGSPLANADCPMAVARAVVGNGGNGGNGVAGGTGGGVIAPFVANNFTPDPAGVSSTPGVGGLPGLHGAP